MFHGLALCFVERAQKSPGCVYHRDSGGGFGPQIVKASLHLAVGSNSPEGRPGLKALGPVGERLRIWRPLTMTFNVFVSVELAPARDLGGIQWQQVVPKTIGHVRFLLLLRRLLLNTPGL